MASKQPAKSTRATPARRMPQAKAAATKPTPARKVPATKAPKATVAATTKRASRPAKKQVTAKPQNNSDLTLAIARMRLEVYHQLHAQSVENKDATGATTQTDAQVRARAKHLVDWALDRQTAEDTDSENAASA